jgi:hypothetical protein
MRIEYSPYEVTARRICDKKGKITQVRVRPFFWALFLMSCLSVLTLALLYHPSAPTLLHVEGQHLVSSGLSDVYLQLTDPGGLPVNQAQIESGAHMTNMDMVTDHSSVSEVGNGHYLVQLHLSMAGPWAITIRTQADGFLSQRHTLFVEVT